MFWLVPSPASLKLTVSDPSEFTVPAALMKCGLVARAGEVARTNPASIIGSVKMTSMPRRMLNLPLMGFRSCYPRSRHAGRLNVTSRAGGYEDHEVALCEIAERARGRAPLPRLPVAPPGGSLDVGAGRPGR